MSACQLDRIEHIKNPFGTKEMAHLNFLGSLYILLLCWVDLLLNASFICFSVFAGF